MSLIIVHSPKGGVGSTMVAANLASALARRNRVVTAIDFGGQEALALHLGIKPEYRDTDAQNGERIDVAAGVRLISTARHYTAQGEAAAALARAGDSDAVVIVDVPSGDQDVVEKLLPHATLRICVLAPDPGSLAVLPRMLSDRAPAHSAPTRFLLNGTDDRLRLGTDIVRFLGRSLDASLIGMIRRDEAVNEALAMLEPLNMFAPTSAAFSDLEAAADIVMGYLPVAERGAA